MLFPKLRDVSTQEVGDKSLRLSPNSYYLCIHLFMHEEMSNTPNELAELHLNSDLALTLNLRLTDFSREEQSRHYLDSINGLIAKFIKLDDCLTKCTCYTAEFNVAEVPDNDTGFFNVIVWIDEMRNWLRDLTPALTACLPQQLGVAHPAADTSTPTTNMTQKRVNSDAKDKHENVLCKYDKYRHGGQSKASAIKALVHDFRWEYNPNNEGHRKKTIQRIIREHRNNED